MEGQLEVTDGGKVSISFPGLFPLRLGGGVGEAGRVTNQSNDSCKV